MKSNYLLPGGLAAALVLALSSCGDGDSSADQTSEDPFGPEPTPYALKVCVVSGEELGSMGKPHLVTHQGTEVRLCCEECVPKFEKDPDKYVAMVKAGEAASVDHSKHNH